MFPVPVPVPVPVPIPVPIPDSGFLLFQTPGERYLSAVLVFLAVLTCWHLQFSKIFAFLFFFIN